MKSVLRFLSGAVLLMTTVAAATADSSAIKVLVNDQAITSFDISQRFRLMQLTHEPGTQKDAMEELINETLEVSEAKAHNMVISDARVNAAYAQIGQNLKMSAAQLDKALGAAGVVPDTLKRRIRAQMTWGGYVDARARYDASLKPADVTAELFAEGGPDKLTTTEFILQQIIFVIPKGSPPGYVDQRRREAEGYRVRYTGCDGAIEEAKSLHDVTVRNIGRRMSTDMTDPEGKEILTTAVGKTTRPYPVTSGLEVVAVCSSRKITGDAEARTAIENKLSLAQDKEVGKDYLKGLRDKAVIKYR